METFRRFEAGASFVPSRELNSLAAEQDAELYFEGLHRVAGRLARQENTAQAGEIWAFLAEEASASAPQVARRAQEELAVLTGGGSIGRRVERLAERFVGEATNPAALLGMAVAGGVYTLGRNALLLRLLSSPASAMSRGFGARALAGLGAFSLEAPAFTLTTRAWHAASGQSSPNSLGSDLLSSYLALGGLKFFGAMGSAAVQRSGAGAFSRAVVPSASAYLGIVAGHSLESSLGLVPDRPIDQVLLDSLAMLLQFQVGGRIVSSALGPRYGAWQSALNERSEQAMRPPWFSPRGWTPAAFGPVPALAPVGGEMPAWRSGILMMSSKGPRSTGNSSIPPPVRSETRAVSERNAFERLQELIARHERWNDAGRKMTLLEALRRSGESQLIPEAEMAEMRWAVHGYLIYQNSSTLRQKVSEGDLASQESLVRRLEVLRPEVEHELGQSRYALATLVQALAYGGRLPYEKMRSFLGAAASLELYQAHPVLAGMETSVFKDPYRFIHQLRQVRRRVEADADRRYKLSTLVDALRWHPEFPSTQLQLYSMVGGASDFVGGLSRRRLRLEVGQLRELNLEQVFLRLLHLKPVLRGYDGQPLGIGYVLMGLRSHGLSKVRDTAVNDTAVQHAHALDFVHNRWMEWGGHYENIASIPKYQEGDGLLEGYRRPGYSRTHLLKENGEAYSDSYLSQLARWGEFLWMHREALDLPPSRPVSVVELAPGRSSSLREFLAPYWERLHDLAPEPFLIALLQLRNRFRTEQDPTPLSVEENAEVLSLSQMLNALYRGQGQEIPGSIKTYAQNVDAILRRWRDWSGHFRRISVLPTRRSRGFSRSEYAMENLKRENGEDFSKSTLNHVVRWGVLLWEHRSQLGLSRSSTLPPPPPPEAE